MEDKVIAHRKKWGKTVPEKKIFYQSRRNYLKTFQASHTLSEQGLQTSLFYTQKKIEYLQQKSLQE